MPPRLNVSWSDQTEDHIARHGVTLEEALHATDDYLDLIRVRANRYSLIGRTRSGRYLTVILERDGRRSWRLITARPVNHRERRRIRRMR